MTTTTVDLRAEAVAEASRLKRARVLLRTGDEESLVRLDVDGAWIAWAKRPRLRRALSGRMCLVWRVAFEESSGRLVDSTLVPLLVDLRGSTSRRSLVWIHSFLQQAGDLIRARVEKECEAWRIEVTRLASARSSMRAQRERDIAGRADRVRRSSQPGLFDRRADRAREARASAAAEAERNGASRLQAILDTAQITPQPARLLLVLLP
jgi:hypothetical protein